MNGLIWFGFVAGVFVVYVLITFVLATLMTMEIEDIGVTFGIAWVIGAVIFVIMSILYVQEAKLLPDMSNKTAIEATAEEMG